MEKKYFTLDEANQMLPYVQTELALLQEIKRNFYRTYYELQQLKKRQPSAETDDEIFKLECRLDFMEMEMQQHINQMLAKGIQVKDIDIGLFDFPAVLNGDEVLLCWRQGESSITHYHGVSEGFAGRKRIP
ncbi:DUF2203 domain-containing protein [Brevibacillus sp. H7]|jgi:hypothetical protein|uniref:DUF2203 domain-containing protein n=1 Tax=Brevibacillus sp. H7 TaxID=3349138 RepID=UPI00381FCB39